MKRYKVTLDSNYCGSKLSVYNNGLSVKTSAMNTSIANFVRATNGVITGKWYWEIKVNILSLSGVAGIPYGIVSEDATDKDTSCVFTSIGYDPSDSGGELKTGSGVSYMTYDQIGYGQIQATSDINSSLVHSYRQDLFAPLNSIIGFALDMDNKTLSLYINGALKDTVPNLPNKTFYPAIGVSEPKGISSSTIDINFGEDYNFKYPIPDGYKAYFRSAELLVWISDMGSKLYYKDNGTDNKLLHPYWNKVTGGLVGSFGRSNIGVSKGKWYFEAYRPIGYRVSAGILSTDATDKNSGGRFLSRTSADKEAYKRFYLASGTGIGFYCCTEGNIATIYGTCTSDLIDFKGNRSNTYDISSYMISSNNDTYGIAIDMDNRQAILYINGKFAAFYKTLPENVYHAAIGITQGTIAVSVSSTYNSDAGMIFNFGEEKPFIYEIPGWYEPYYRSYYMNYHNCGFDPNHCGSDLVIYNDNGIKGSAKQFGATARCRIPLYSGKWYWEVTRKTKSVVHSAIGYIQHNIGLLSMDAVLDYNSMAPTSATGTGIQYCPIDNYADITLNCSEIYSTEDIQPGKCIFSPENNTSLSTQFYTPIDKPIGLLLDLDNDTITFYCGSIANSYTVNIPHKAYYPAVALNIILRNVPIETIVSTYGIPDAEINTGYNKPFVYPLPNGAKPYYMASNSSNYKVPRCKLDRSYCCTDIELYADGLSSRLNRIGSGGVRCNTGVKSGKWYWEVKRNTYNINVNGIIGYSVVGLVSEDANVNWDIVNGFTIAWGDNLPTAISTGFGLHYMALSQFVLTNNTFTTEILGTSTVASNGVFMNYVTNSHLMTPLYSDQYETIGFLLDLDNYTVTIIRGNDSSKQISIAVLPGKTYYPAIANTLVTQSFLDAHGPLEVHMNFGELSPFEFNVPDGAKPYYMAYQDDFDDLKIY